MKRSYIDYAMSVIVGRALPDVRDGLKPVHRRILFAMNELGMTPDKPFKKCARIVGEVLGKYHPHGDSAVYESLVRMAQDFATRYLTIDGHGNFGSVDGDSAAAMRYTEARMHKITTSMLADIDCETVDFTPNFDGSLQEPSVLPVRLPMLLLNGVSGIAVGMATNIPPHNLCEIVDGTIAMIDNPEITIEGLMQYIKGPDFPTAATIIGTSEIKKAYETGRGSIKMSAVSSIEELPGGNGRQGRTAIVVTEIPYQVNKAALIEKIADLVKEGKIQGISDIRDESDREGMRVVIELKRDAKPDVVRNNLYKQTALMTSFGVNMVALVGQQPRLLNLYEVLNEFIEHRVDVITRRTIFFLKKAKARAHILEGLMIALNALDEVIELIKKSKNTEEARNGLMSRFGLDVEQANAILEMQLRRLTGLEQDKIRAEYDDLIKKIAEYEAILADRNKVLALIKNELLEDKEKYGDDRKTQILPEQGELNIEDLTPNTAMAVFITRQGYIKRISLDTFERQNRATRGKGGMKTKEDDDVDHFFTAMMHDKVLFFSSKGVVYSLNVYDFPEGSRQSKGLPIINVLPIEQDEQITAVVPVSEFNPDTNLIMLTKKGYIKRIGLDNFVNIRRNGIIAIGLEEGDTLNWVKLAQNNDEIIIGTSCGMAIRFSIEDLRPLGRSARGVNSMKLRTGDTIIGCDVVPKDYDADLLVVTSDGFGKRSKLSEFRPQNRGGLGLIATKFKSAASRLVALTIVDEHDDIMVVTANGIVTRVSAADISRQGRPATGVKVQNLVDNDTVVSVNKIINPDDDSASSANVDSDKANQQDSDVSQGNLEL
ncbi:TPA: DNA gyrase subunit A [Candidatus Galligastranaerophilus intestinavium]|uniref:DNA gyrase subunit A n=1 Tax=Candidatus Galligastranaerophilus intestinavium TaxID=2840836 RepID=A0A9D1FI71_9BACT|nr:DNA gyrase subunit A [Candidatus Galligastranaerophilus intestinavium]